MKRKNKQKRVSFVFLIMSVIFVMASLFFMSGFAFLRGDLSVQDFGINTQPTSVMSQLNPDVTQIPASTVAITPENASNAETFIALLAEVNRTRVANGAAPVALNPTLSLAAGQQASYNASIYDVRHSDANFNTVDHRIERLGYTYAHVGENLLSNWTLDGIATFQQWQASPSHNENMLNPDFTEIGLAYHVTPIGQVYHAMVLARAQ